MNVLIADDHALFRQGLTQFMGAGFQNLAVTEAGSFYDVIALKDSLAGFDLILLDLAMPGMDGFAGVALVRDHAPEVPLVIVSASERREDVLRALELGVTGYISKSLRPDLPAGLSDAALGEARAGDRPEGSVPVPFRSAAAQPSTIGGADAALRGPLQPRDRRGAATGRADREGPCLEHPAFSARAAARRRW